MYVKTNNLPIVVQAALKRHGYGKKDIKVEFQDTVRSGSAGGKGSRSYVTTVDITFGNTQTHMGSWGGPNPFNPNNPVDMDSHEFNLKQDLWVIKGSEGYRNYATLYCHPKARSDFDYVGATEPTDAERKVLRAYSHLKSGPYRKAALSGLDQAIESCIAKGFIRQSRNGACRITTEGKNALAA